MRIRRRINTNTTPPTLGFFHCFVIGSTHPKLGEQHALSGAFYTTVSTLRQHSPTWLGTRSGARARAWPVFLSKIDVEILLVTLRTSSAPLDSKSPTLDPSIGARTRSAFPCNPSSFRFFVMWCAIATALHAHLTALDPPQTWARSVFPLTTITRPLRGALGTVALTLTGQSSTTNSGARTRAKSAFPRKTDISTLFLAVPTITASTRAHLGAISDMTTWAWSIQFFQVFSVTHCYSFIEGLKFIAMTLAICIVASFT